jgi:hypothetical protein
MKTYNELLTESMRLAKIVKEFLDKGDFKSAWKTYDKDDVMFKSCNSYRQFLKAVK